MTVIVMLILAGVSLNALVGDNGIITNSMDAKMKNGMAILEEFLQEKYVENYENFSDEDIKVVQLQNKFPDFFYIPVNEGVGGLKYIVDSKGHSLFLIKKSGLPKEIREQLVGGDAGMGTYLDYATLNDVYGVTGDLKVYYSSQSGELLGITDDELDKDDPYRIASLGTTMNAFLINQGYDTTSKNGSADGKINSEELKSVVELRIKDSDGITNLNDFYNFSNLKSLILDNYSGSLNGIGACPKIHQILLINCNCENYSELGKLNNLLDRLYLTNVTDEVANKFCTDISKYDFTKLKYFGIIGNLYRIWNYTTSDWEGQQVETSSLVVDGTKSTNRITDISYLSKLSKTTKEAIEFLFLYNNEITDTVLEGSGDDTIVTKYALEYISDYINVVRLRIEYNNLTSLKGIENLSKLKYLFAAGNSFGLYEIYDSSLEGLGSNEDSDSLASLSSLNNLYYVQLESNNELKHLKYLKDIASIKYLYLASCSSFVDVGKIKDILNNCYQFTLDSVYNLDILDESKTTFLDVSNQTITLSNLESIGNCSKLRKLGMDNTVITDNLGGTLTNSVISEKLENCLKKLSKLVYASFDNLKGLEDVNFINEWGETNQLRQLILLNTDVTDLSPIEDHCLVLKSLLLNNNSIVLKDYITLIDRLGVKEGYSWNWDTDSFRNGNGAGLCLLTRELLIQYTECDGIENFCINHKFSSFNIALNLTEISSLKVVSVMNLNNYSKLIVPANLEGYYIFNGASTKCEFQGNTTKASWVRFYSINFNNDINELIKVVNYFCGTEKIDYFCLTCPISMEFSYQGFEITKKLSLLSLEIHYYGQKNLNISGFYKWLLSDNIVMRYCSFTGGLDELYLIGGKECLQLTCCELQNTSFLTGYTELRKLVLNDNKIGSINQIKNLNGLYYLNLTNNSIGEFTSVYNEETGEVEQLNVVTDLFIPMSKKNGGTLEYLYLSGNNDILSISNLAAYYDKDKRSGF